MLRLTLMFTTLYRVISDAPKCASQAVTPHTRPSPTGMCMLSLPCLDSDAQGHAAPLWGCLFTIVLKSQTLHTGCAWTPSSAHSDFLACASFPPRGFPPYPVWSGLRLPHQICTLQERHPHTLPTPLTEHPSHELPFLFAQALHQEPFKADIFLLPRSLTLHSSFFLSFLHFPCPTFLGPT